MKVLVNDKLVDVNVSETVNEIPKDIQIQQLKQNLADTDYIACKIAEGAVAKEEYAAIISKRQSWRDEINALEEAE